MMRKLIVIPAEGNPYRPELLCAKERLNGTAMVVGTGELSYELLEREGVGIVISGGLDPKWYALMRGMNVVSVTIGPLEPFAA
ncbi:MAG: hypothetical protein AB7D51_05820 [Desulfovibrionaceae bacterium]